MTKYSRRSKRKISTETIEKPAKKPVPYKAAYPPKSIPSTAAGKTEVYKPLGYDPQKHVVTELKYSSLVGGLVIILLIIAYILFR